MFLEMAKSSFMRAFVVVRPSTLACRLATVALQKSKNDEHITIILKSYPII